MMKDTREMSPWLQPWVQVTLTENLAPYTKGDRPALPREVADRLIAEGRAKDPVALPSNVPQAAADDEPRRPRRRYLTRA
jgi:hypothetical protein